MKKLFIDGKSLNIEDFINVARNHYEVHLTEEAKEKMQKSRDVVEKIVENEKPVYGINTGFGKFCNVKISKEESKNLQKNLIMSHACGVGNPLKEDAVRGIMLLRANALANGFSGIRISTVETLLEMLNKNVIPVIPEKGSLGASGDLAPLAHMVLVMLGMGEAYYKNERLSGKEAMKKANIKTIELEGKEGLALINGTQVMTSIGALAIYDSKILLKTTDIAISMTSEALEGITDAYDSLVHEVRNQTGQIITAENLRRILNGSKNTTKQGEKRVQDAYTLRCVPQIHGASKDAFNYVNNVINNEINAVTDNPIIFPDEDKIISAGNFHGQPVALAMDFLAIAISEMANVSERRIERLVNTEHSKLPAFLVKDGGVNSGFMIAQYAAAALVSENKVLAHPASVDSIPSSANQEDHVSMGTIASRKAREIIYNASRVLAIELIAAVQAIDLRGGKEKLSPATKSVYNLIRKNISYWEKDREMYPDINNAAELILNNSIVKEVENIIGEIKI
ncbi:histidine ammonia-lyase 1 [Tepiditoga spiralis]|uniref:Histidine ammonia-lyase n=1 Tax=Tepiditoga spiralis TaxID=2108365 RepID=A0A7G1G9Q1_9BACT|nr:histidine ammonia-lyase [Tepiditoga spiralis]BBE31984.1 histidine ammonia-lyase 1 [Tepiditoga spiralis]